MAEVLTYQSRQIPTSKTGSPKPKSPKHLNTDPHPHKKDGEREGDREGPTKITG